MTTHLPADLHAIARAELAPGESVEWAAQPSPMRALLGGLGLWLFAVPWTAFSVFWMAMASRAVHDWTSVEVAFPLFGLPFVIIGLLMLSTPWWAWRGAQRTLYAVTDRRAILFEAAGLRGITVRSFSPRALRDVRRTEQPDGSGSLVFSETVGRDSDGDRTTTAVGFSNVPDVRAAEAAVAVLAATHDSAAEERRADLMDDAVDDALGASRRRARV